MGWEIANQSGDHHDVAVEHRLRISLSEIISVGASLPANMVGHDFSEDIDLRDCMDRQML